MDPKFPVFLRCGPEEAGFDGAKGIGLNNPTMKDGGFFRLRRGSIHPNVSGDDCRNQLFWLTPLDGPAQLLWCNPDGVWFNCAFERFDPAQ